MGKLSTNVLVIGKSGVGKSSLLNYLFDREIQKTGTGKPVTEEGIFPFDYEYDSNFNIRIYDTWGLEPDKAVKWESLIIDEVKKHEKKNIHEWFHTIIFCLSANSSRVEDFEIKTINALLKDKNRVIVAITHSESASDKNSCVIKESLLRETDLEGSDIIFVNNVEKKLIGKEVHRFGKKQIFVTIIKNLWKTFKQKVPYQVREILYKEFEVEKRKIQDMIPSQYELLLRKKALETFEEEVNSEIQVFALKTMNKINKKYEEAINYYNELSFQYSHIGELLNKEEFKISNDLKFNALEEFERKIKQTVRMMREKLEKINQTLANKFYDEKNIVKTGIILKKYLSSGKELKKEIENVIEQYLEEVNYYMQQKVGVIENKIQEMDIERVCENQIEFL